MRAKNKHSCRNCGSHKTVLVWENIELHSAGMPPKFIGCVECNKMVKTDKKNIDQNS